MGFSNILKLSILVIIGLLFINTVRGDDNSTVTKSDKCVDIGMQKCKNGLILTTWEPQGNLSLGDRCARAIVYFSAMIFMFLGVSIVSDRFMASIEVITSKEKEVTIKRPNGETTVVNVRVWNETVSNLTLMALGSSAPEIMLSVIEVCGNNFNAGDLGPSTIVGSAAFNLFVIIGLCVYVIPDDEVRRIKHLSVFFITASWSIFAYLWLYLIIAVISEGEVEIWEGVVTFMFFPITVGMAYVADTKIFFKHFLKKKITAHAIDGIEAGDKQVEGEETFKGLDSDDPEVREFERHRKDFIEIMRELRKKNPNMDVKSLEEMAEMEALNKGPKSRAFYRIQATRKLTGGGNVIKKSKINKASSMDDLKVEIVADDTATRVFFEPGHYTVMENVGTFQCTVSRAGGNLHHTVYVDYRTEDGTANAGQDYEYAEGTLTFYPGETHKQFDCSVIDDDVFEEDEHFYVGLVNVRVGNSDGLFSPEEQAQKVQIANPSMATVMILDDDHGGIFHFEVKEVTVPESIGEAHVKVCRSSGARGIVRIPYQTEAGTARGGGVDFEDVKDELVFINDQTEAFIKIRIIDDEEYEKHETFYVTLGEPRYHTKADGAVECLTGEQEEEQLVQEDDVIAELGRPKCGEIVKTVVHIRESMEFKGTVDKLLKKANISLVVGTSSWREQFIEALSVSAGDDEEGGGGEEDEEGEVEEKLPSCMDYVMHFLSVIWKLFFALIPPTEYWGGWACFVVSILLIGLLTAFIGDIASHVGCTIGLKDAITAISFVALGTSVPDTFASKVAAVGDETADSSVGNVTGSNAVNVFLGIGIAWTLAALVHAGNGTKFIVDPGSLGFSVTVFCCFAFFAIMVMLIRRKPFIGGELGGPRNYKIATSVVFYMLWIMYVLLSSLEAYCHIKGF